jgi:eukaryotic-like serine/threonine-protein kinase
MHDGTLKYMAPRQLGRFEIAGKLGEGAMGVVYQAHDPLLDRSVAVKTVSLALSREELEVFEQRFFREAKSAGRLNHPNIVTIYDVGKSEGFAYIAMEFLRGKSLREILDSGAILRVAHAVDIAAQVADGLAFAHQHSIVHRDIKPANIMVLENGAAKITDFGIATVPTGSRTLTGAFGSPKYMSPEQVSGGQLDARSDIFSLSAVLYEMLTGVPAFNGDQLDTILYRVVHETPPAPSERNRLVPPTLDQIVAKGLAKRPEQRYQSALEFAVDLKRHKRKRLAISASGLAPAAKPEGAKSQTSGDATVLISVGEAAAASARPAPVAAAKKPTKAHPPHGPVLVAAAVCAAIIVVAGAMLWHKGRNTNVAQTAPVPVAVTSPSVSAEPTPAPAEQTPAEPAENLVANPPPETVKPAVAPTVALARLTFAVSPWGEVYVDGKKQGVTPPLSEVNIPAGKHTIEIRNTSLAPYQEQVDLLPDKTVRIKHKFQ